MRLLNRFREYLRRHNDLSAGRDPVWDDVPEQQAPTETMPAADVPTATMPATYEPHGIDTPEMLAALREKAEADARTAQASVETEAWGKWDDPATPAPLVPAHEPPPMPPSDLSRIMVSQIPAPDPDITSYGRAHGTAEYLRKIGAATGTWTDMEATGFWEPAALTPAAPGGPAGFHGEKTGGLGLPVPAGEFILRFDEDGPGEPFSFTVDPPAPAGPEVAA